MPSPFFHGDVPLPRGVKYCQRPDLSLQKDNASFDKDLLVTYLPLKHLKTGRWFPMPLEPMITRWLIDGCLGPMQSICDQQTVDRGHEQ